MAPATTNIPGQPMTTTASQHVTTPTSTLLTTPITTPTNTIITTPTPTSEPVRDEAIMLKNLPIILFRTAQIFTDNAHKVSYYAFKYATSHDHQY